MMMAEAGQNSCAMLDASLRSKIALGAAVVACSLAAGTGLAKAHDRHTPTQTLSGTAS